jgi:hypothetical protein
MTFICKWYLESLNISFWVQCSKSRQSTLLPFFTPYVPYKTQFSPPSSPYPWAASATTPPHPRGHRPLLPLVSFSLLALSSLSVGGELLCQGSITRRGELPHRGAAARSASGWAPPLDLRTLIPALKVVAVKRDPPRTVSVKAALKVVAVMRHGADDAKASRVDGRWTPTSLIPQVWRMNWCIL